MGHSVASTIRSLEKEYAKERAELAVYNFAYAVTVQWDYIAASDDDGIDIARKLRITSAALPTLPIAINYLDSCKRKGIVPNHRHLCSMLAPWTAKLGIPKPYHQPLSVR